jgi:hypothetical protein
MSDQANYGAVLNVLIERALQIGRRRPGSDVALACYQIIESARSEAEVWGIGEEEIGLHGVDTSELLREQATAAI